MPRKGRKVGQKKSDFTFTDPTGEVWASKLEYEVYVYLQGAISRDGSVRRCGKGDTFSYTQPLPGTTHCLECGGSRCAQSRNYTADLFVDTGTHTYWLEVKGRFAGPKRALFRAFRKSRPDIVVRFLAQADSAVGKGRLSGYFERYLKTTPFAVWGTKKQLDKDWIT